MNIDFETLYAHPSGMSEILMVKDGRVLPGWSVFRDAGSVQIAKLLTPFGGIPLDTSDMKEAVDVARTLMADRDVRALVACQQRALGHISRLKDRLSR